ncbi:transmembrane protein 17 isoform 1-T1 [Dugong dugon]
MLWPGRRIASAAADLAPAFASYEAERCLRGDLKNDEMVSSLALQVSLYFNTYFFPLWWVSSIMMLHMKYPVLPDYYKFIVVTIIILVTLIEVIRLYLGYMGNLQEKVPELAGFWLLSLLLQLPLILFLLFNEGLKSLPMEKAIHIIFTLFLTFQVVAAFLALKRMVNQLATRFHLQDFDRLSANRGDTRRMRSCIEEI